MASVPGIHQFRSGACLSYAFYDRETGKAAFIDPCLDLLEEYRAFAAEERLEPVFLIDTHLHDDHCSATHELHQLYRCPIAMAGTTKSRRPSVLLKSGDLVRIGRQELNVLEVSGHTSDSLVISAPGMIFTGDTLLIGSIGSVVSLSQDVFHQARNVRELLGALAGDPLVFPAHDQHGLLFSTLDIEKSRNPIFSLFPGQEPPLIKRKGTGLDPAIGVFNLEKHPGGTGLFTASLSGESDADEVELPPFASISIQKLAGKLKSKREQGVVVDVRRIPEFEAGSIPGALNIPLSELGFSLSKLRSLGRIYVFGYSNFRTEAAARTLSYVGLRDIVAVSGGFQAWKQAGYPVQKKDT